MMWCGFRMNIRTSLFRLTHQFYRFLTADMLNIDAGSGLFRQLQIPFHQCDLRLSGRAADSVMFTGLSAVHTVVLDIFRVFFMETDGHIQLCGDFHGPSHQFRIQQGHTVIRESHSTRRCQLLHIRQLFSLHAHGHVSTGSHMDPRLCSLVQDILQGLLTVHSGLRVRHQHYGGHTTLRRCRSSGVDIFLRCKTGISEMHMHIHQSRSD